jgi:hypothetical protein
MTFVRKAFMRFYFLRWSNFAKLPLNLEHENSALKQQVFEIFVWDCKGLNDSVYRRSSDATLPRVALNGFTKVKLELPGIFGSGGLF